MAENPSTNNPHQSPATVRAVEASDEASWKALFRDYRTFYKLEGSEEIVTTVWEWLMDPAHECNALVAEVEGEVVAIADYRRFSRPIGGSVGIWLDDLFTGPEARGKGAARALIARLTEIAKAEGATVVRWITASDNHTAQALYDDVATRTQWVTYDAAPAGQTD